MRPYEHSDKLHMKRGVAANSCTAPHNHILGLTDNCYKQFLQCQLSIHLYEDKDKTVTHLTRSGLTQPEVVTTPKFWVNPLCLSLPIEMGLTIEEHRGEAYFNIPDLVLQPRRPEVTP